jgi:hypothetical protein
LAHLARFPANFSWTLNVDSHLWQRIAIVIGIVPAFEVPDRGAPPAMVIHVIKLPPPAVGQIALPRMRPSW